MTVRRKNVLYRDFSYIYAGDDGTFSSSLDTVFM